MAPARRRIIEGRLTETDPSWLPVVAGAPIRLEPASPRRILHVVKNAAPTALAVMGIQLGYLLGGSILIETVFAWPGTGLLLNDAIFQRDLPLLQGTILVLAMFFVVLNLAVDVLQTALDPRVQRS